MDAVSGTLYVYTWMDRITKSTDGGWTWSWTHFPTLTCTRVTAIRIDPKRTQYVYAATDNQGVWRTTDGGSMWEAWWCSGDKYVNSLVIDPDATCIIYAGTREGGVFTSKNCGITWKPINSGLGNLSICCLKAGPSGKATLYAGTKGGLWKYSRSTGINREPDERENSRSSQILEIKPNPFITVTEISYNIPLIGGSDIASKPSVRVSLKIYSITGQLINTLVNTVQVPGHYSIIWDGKGQFGKTMKSEIYFCRLCVGDFIKVAKIIHVG